MNPLAISKEIKAQILRYHFVEHWGPSTIAAQLGVHHSSVDRVLSQAGLPKAERDPRPSIVDPYVAFITETLALHPKLTAARLYAMAQARGYPGAPSQFRARVAQLRPRKPAEAYLRLRTLPGEQGQVDWALCRARHSLGLGVVGPLRHRHYWLRRARPDGLRHGAQLEPADLASRCWLAMSGRFCRARCT